MTTYDFHMHLFPEKLAERTLCHLRQVSGCQTFTDGTVAGTLRAMEEGGVDGGVVLHIATKPAQQQNVNHFAAQVQRENSRLRCFGSIHPAAPDASEELHRIKELGLPGVKLHPDYQGFYFGEERYYPLYELAASLGLLVTIHAGWDPVSPGEVHASPKEIARVKRDIPSLILIGAHMGGMKRYEDAYAYYEGLPNFYVDTSMSAVFFNDPARFEALVRRIGVEHVLFGTDSPWDKAENERALIEATHLTEEEKALLYSGNARRLLGCE